MWFSLTEDIIGPYVLTNNTPGREICYTRLDHSPCSNMEYKTSYLKHEYDMHKCYMAR